MDPHPGRDLVGGLEAYPRHLVRQLIRVLLDDPVHIGPVVLIDLHCQRRGDPVFLQEDHSLAHFFLLFHLNGDLPGLALADPLDLRQPLRFLLDDPEGVFPELLHDPPSQSGSHAFNGAGAKITLDGHQIFRFAQLRAVHLELGPVHLVDGKLSGQFQKFSLLNVVELPHTGQIPIFIIQIEYRVPVVLIAEFNFFYETCDYCHTVLRGADREGLRRLDFGPPPEPPPRSRSPC